MICALCSPPPILPGRSQDDLHEYNTTASVWWYEFFVGDALSPGMKPLSVTAIIIMA